MTNNDDGDPRDPAPGYDGTVVVLAPIARPAPPTSPAVSDFEVNVNVPDPAAITDLTVTLELFDTPGGLPDLDIKLIAPNGAAITLVTNQNILVGTTTVTTSHNIGLTGNSLGIFDWSTTSPGFPVGTTFDDTATRDIVDLNPAGDYGAPRRRPRPAGPKRITSATGGLSPTLSMERLWRTS